MRRLSLVVLQVVTIHAAAVSEHGSIASTAVQPMLFPHAIPLIIYARSYLRDGKPTVWANLCFSTSGYVAYSSYFHQMISSVNQSHTLGAVEHLHVPLGAVKHLHVPCAAADRALLMLAAAVAVDPTMRLHCETCQIASLASTYRETTWWTYTYSVGRLDDAFLLRYLELKASSSHGKLFLICLFPVGGNTTQHLVRAREQLQSLGEIVAIREVSFDLNGASQLMQHLYLGQAWVNQRNLTNKARWCGFKGNEVTAGQFVFFEATDGVGVADMLSLKKRLRAEFKEHSAIHVSDTHSEMLMQARLLLNANTRSLISSSMLPIPPTKSSQSRQCEMPSLQQDEQTIYYNRGCMHMMNNTDAPGWTLFDGLASDAARASVVLGVLERCKLRFAFMRVSDYSTLPAIKPNGDLDILLESQSISRATSCLKTAFGHQLHLTTKVAGRQIYAQLLHTRGRPKITLDLHDGFTWKHVNVHPCWSTAVISRSNNHIPHHSDDCAIRWLQHVDYQMDNLTAKATKHREWVEQGNCTFTRFSQSTTYFNSAPDGQILENCQQTCAIPPGLNMTAPSIKGLASVTNGPQQQNLQVALPMRDLHNTCTAAGELNGSQTLTFYLSIPVAAKEHSSIKREILTRFASPLTCTSIDPLKLFSWRRFDIYTKWAVASSLLRHQQPKNRLEVFAKNVYLDHIRVLNGFSENSCFSYRSATHMGIAHGPQAAESTRHCRKRNADDFVNAFVHTFRSMQQGGWSTEQSGPIPFVLQHCQTDDAPSFVPYDGAHRIASAVALALRNVTACFQDVVTKSTGRFHYIRAAAPKAARQDHKQIGAEPNIVISSLPGKYIEFTTYSADWFRRGGMNEQYMDWVVAHAVRAFTHIHIARLDYTNMSTACMESVRNRTAFHCTLSQGILYQKLLLSERLIFYVFESSAKRAAACSMLVSRDLEQALPCVGTEAPRLTLPDRELIINTTWPL